MIYLEYLSLNYSLVHHVLKADNPLLSLIMYLDAGITKLVLVG